MSRKNESFGEKFKRRLKQPLSKQKVVGYVRTKLGLVKPEELPLPTLAAPESDYPELYHDWIKARVRLRAPEYPAKPDPALFSIITPVFDTPATFLKEMGESIFAQDFLFQWVICDNGSSHADTLNVLKQFAKDSRVTLVRLDQNEGIMGGTRAAFDAATGRYVLPVDSDDTLYPDALRVMASCLERAGWPALAYSDEDKMHEQSVPCWPFFKPSWDPALFLNCCYIAHLCALDRKIANALGAYTDGKARGCHDWDTFTRLIQSGYEPVHVPEVLYSWRIHAGSSSSFADRAKMYTIECQQYVLANFLAKTTRPGLFDLRTNPLFGHIGMWYASRQHVEPRPIHAFVFSEGSAAQLQRCLKSMLGDVRYPALKITVIGTLTPEHLQLVDSFRSATCAPDFIRAETCPDGYMAHLSSALQAMSDDALVLTISDSVHFSSLDWGWEACGVFDLNAKAALCCGRILDTQNRISSAGEYFGFGGLAGSPDEGRSASEPGYSGFVFCDRSVSAAPFDFHLCAARFAKQALQRIPPDASRFLLGRWLAAEALTAGLRVIYSPRLWLTHSPEWHAAPAPSASENHAFLSRYHALVAGEHFYPRFFSVEKSKGYTVALPHQRAAVINGVLSCLQGPHDFVNKIELSPRAYAPPWIPSPTPTR